MQHSFLADCDFSSWLTHDFSSVRFWMEQRFSIFKQLIKFFRSFVEFLFVSRYLFLFVSNSFLEISKGILKVLSTFDELLEHFSVQFMISIKVFIPTL